MSAEKFWVWPSLDECNSVVRASNQCVEGHRLKFISGTQIFFLSHIRDMLIKSFLASLLRLKFSIILYIIVQIMFLSFMATTVVTAGF